MHCPLHWAGAQSRAKHSACQQSYIQLHLCTWLPKQGASRNIDQTNSDVRQGQQTHALTRQSRLWHGQVSRGDPGQVGCCIVSCIPRCGVIRQRCQDERPIVTGQVEVRGVRLQQAGGRGPDGAAGGLQPCKHAVPCLAMPWQGVWPHTHTRSPWSVKQSTETCMAVFIEAQAYCSVACMELEYRAQVCTQNLKRPRSTQHHRNAALWQIHKDQFC